MRATSGRATAVRWNSLENVTPQRRRPRSDATGQERGASTSSGALEYAATINTISRGLVKASLLVVLLSLVGRRFFDVNDVGAALGAPLALLVTNGTEIQVVAGWVCVAVVVPLVISAMVLNNAERMSLGLSRGRPRALSVADGATQGLKDGREDVGGGRSDDHETLAITPPARKRYSGLSVVVGGDAPGVGGSGSVLFTPNAGRERDSFAKEGDITAQMTPGSTRSGRSSRSARGPGTPGSRRVLSKGPKTPIEGILQDFDAAADAAAAEARDASTVAQGFVQGMGLGQHGTTFMSMATMQQAGLPGVGFAEQMMQQPLSNTYRPSAVQKGYVSTPLRSDGSVLSSLPTDRDRVLAELGIDEDILERAVEALREWIACRLLQPLVKIIGVAHMNVINSAKSIGIEISPDSLIDLNDYGIEPSSRLSDQMLSLGNFYAQVTQQMGMPANASNPAVLKRYEQCLQAIVTYNGLLRLLRAELIPGLLPASPEGYILKRIKELANGTAMYDFVFDAGGEINGKPWNPEYPTDTALVLYLFGCFLAAPFWSFADKTEHTKVEGPADVLFLGKLPPRIGGEFTAILPSRLPKGCAGTALQGLQLGTTMPHIAITVMGVPKLTESGQLGLFRSIVLWLLYVSEANGVLGNVSLSSLHLEGVLSRRRGFAFIEQLRKLHLW